MVALIASIDSQWEGSSIGGVECVISKPNPHLQSFTSVLGQGCFGILYVVHMVIEGLCPMQKYVQCLCAQFGERYM